MAETTEISWADATWNVITGCSIKSTGCNNCYAMRMAATRLRGIPSRAGLTHEVNGHHVWTGEVRFNEDWLDQPLRWKKPKDIFVCAHSDLFHESVPYGWVMRILNVIAQCPQHRFQILTKRPDRAAHFFAQWADLTGEGHEPKLVRGPEATRAAHPSGRGQLFADMLDAMGAPPPGCAYPTFDWMEGMIGWPAAFRHVWVGASVERQREADERHIWLLGVAALGWNTWVSYEPALGPIDWSRWKFLRWMVSGGESGPYARPSHPDWHRATRDWCKANSVPYHFKQHGSWQPFLDRDNDDPDWRQPYSKWGRNGRFQILNLAGGCGFHGERVHVMRNVGKKAAGALLDGRQWREMPR